MAGASAVTEYVFDNENGNNDWTQAANWSLRLPDGTIENPNNSIPQTADSVRIPDGFTASYVAVFDGGANLLNPIPPIDCLAVDPGATLWISKGPLTINTSATIDGRLQMGSPSVHNTDLAKITGSGTVTVNGELDWRSGSIDNNMVIAEAGVVKISALGNRSGSPSVSSSPSVTGQLLNHGLIEVFGPESLTATELNGFVGPARIFTGGVGEIRNQGELRIPGDVQWLSNGGVGLINLADGTITKSGTGSTFIGINFENDGTLELQQGQLVIGDVPGGVDDGISSGEFQLGRDTNFGSFHSLTTDTASKIVGMTGSSVSILGGHNRIGGIYDVPLTYVGVAGSLRGHLLFNGDGTTARVENLILEGGTVGGPGTMNIDGDFEWRSGALGYGGNSTNSGTINLRGTTNLVGEGTKSIGSGNSGGSTVVNYGAITWTGTGEIRSDPGGQWINEGTIRIQTDAPLGQYDGLLRWSNPGTIIKEPDPSNPTMGIGSQVLSLEFLENTGTIELNAGTLNHGTRFSCTSQVDCGIVSRGEGVLNLNGGDLTSTQRVILEDGVIAGSGTITASIEQSGGVISPGNSPGLLSINGNLNATAGTLSIEVTGSPTDGDGNDAAGTQFDRVNVSGSVAIADLEVRVAPGYQPSLNDRYVVLTGGSVTGPVTDNAISLGMTVFRNDATIELEFTSSANSPPVANSGGPYVVDEGSPFQLNAIGSTDPDQSAASLQYEWDFDYNGATFVPDAVGIQVAHTIADSSTDPLQYAVRVTDDEGRSNIATASVTVQNVAPNLKDALGNPRVAVVVDPLSVATLTGQFDDPGNDTHTVLIDWGDGSTLATLNLNPGDRSFTAFHSYPQTSGEQSYTVFVTVLDGDLGSDDATTGVLISNQSGSLQGVKFEDRNANGIQDLDELGLSGWTIELVDPATESVVDTALTAAGGIYEFTGVSPGDYAIREVQQPEWRQTSPVGDIRRVSLDATGIEASLHSDSPAVSADGRFIAFTSLAENIVTGDTNGWRDVFVKDTVTGAVQRVSLAIDGSQANGPSYQPSISGDGNVVVFRSLASNLVQDDRNDAGGIFMFDRRNSETRQISVNLNPGEADDESYAPVISGDGRFVAFSSTASNLVPNDTNQVADIFLFDLATDLIQRVSVSDAGVQGDLESYQPSISHDGRFVAFTSASRTFESTDRDGDLDVYVFDRSRQSLEWISKSFSGIGGDGPSFDPAVSADGEFVAFASSSANLVPGDLNLETDVFLGEISTGRLQRITYGDGPSSKPSLNSDASKVLFTSYASDLVEGDTNSGPHIFLYDRPLAYFDRLAQSPSGNATEHVSIGSVFSSDGSTIAFASSGVNLVASDGNSARDVFVQHAVGVHFVTLDDVETITGLDFGNQFRLSTIGGQKYADQNGNGQRDADTETGEFLEPGIDDWTIRLVDSRSGQSWETVTSSIDLNNDGLIDPYTESGIYEFGSLPPGDYEVFELTQEGWFPTFPRLVLTPPANFQAAPNNDAPVIAVGPDSRLYVPRDIPGRVAGPSLPVAPVQFIPATAVGTPEQLPILYVKGFNDDGVGWSESGQYFTTLADVTDGRRYAEGTAGIETYGIQFWGKDNGNPNLTDDDSEAYLKTLEELANPNESFHKPDALEFLLESGQSILSNLSNPAQWIPECESLLDLSTCTIPALTFDFQEARSDYNTNGLARYHAQNLVDLLAEDLGKSDELELFSQVNFVTHSAGGLDTRAMLALLQQSGDRGLQESVANVIYTAPPFGGSTLAELAVPFFEEASYAATLAYPWTFEVVSDLAFGPFETLITAFIAEPIAQAMHNIDGGISGTYDSLSDRINVIPTEQEIRDAIRTTRDDLDNLIKTVSGQVLGESFGIAEIDDAFTNSAESFSSTVIFDAYDDLVIPIVKQFLTTIVGLPANPKLKDDLRPYEAIHSNLEQFAPNLDVPQFVVWGEGGFLRYGTQMIGVDTPLPTPVNLGPSLEEAAANPNSLHAYGDADRNNLDFSNQDIQPGDGNLSRTSALFLTDLAGGYMKALAGFDRHTHGSINSEFFGEESDIQGSFQANDEDDTASIGEVLVETFLTPVTGLEISTAAHVVDETNRLYRVGSAAEISFAPEDRAFMDIFERRFHVTASAVEYRIDRPGNDPTTWQSVDHATFGRAISDIVSGLAIDSEQPFTLEWRSINQHGGKEAIRSAQFIIDTSAPSLNQIEVIDAEVPSDTSQIALPSTTSPRSLLDSGRVFGQLGDSALAQVLASQSIDRIVSLQRDKTIRLTFDSPATIQYAWNDPQLTSARASTLGDPNGGTLELLIKKRIIGEIQTPGLGVDYLHEGVQTLYYRALDGSGNSTSIQSLTVLVDDTSPMLEFTADENEIVGRNTPLSFFATDIGAGIGNASIDVPGVGTLRKETNFSFGESNFHEIVQSGEPVSLTARATDRVSNAVTEHYQVIYDYLAPTIEIVDVTSSVTLLDGRIVTTIPKVTLTVAINDDTAGFDPDALHWSVGSLDSGIAVPGTFQQNDLGQFVATLPLGVGLNNLQLQASDRVGNVGSKVIALYRVPGHIVSTDRGDRVTGIDFGNSGLGSIQGVKYDDLNENGVHDLAEPGIAGVTIYIDSNENGALDTNEPAAITGDRGEYRFDNVFGGDYDLREVVPLGWTPTGPASGQQLVTIAAGENLEDVDFGNAFLGATLGGTVYEDENGNGRQDLGENGLEGWEVALDIDGDGSKDAFTNSAPDGSYLFSGLDAGSYALSIAGQSGWIGSTDDRIATTIGDAEVIDKLDFGVFRQAEIAGVVFGDENGNGLQDAGERNLVGWEIRIDLGNDGSVDQTLLTNTRGFTVTDVPPGTHRIQVVDQPGVRRTVPAKTDSYLITVESDSVVDGILFGQQDRRSEISGTKFFDRNGDSIRQGDEPGLAGWTIYADLNDNETLDVNEPRTVSDDDGNYALRVVAGEYIIREVQQDGWVQTFPRSFTTEAITDNDQLNLSPKVAGDYVAWVEFDDPKRLLLSDGVSTQVIVEADIALPYFDLDASGHVVWSQTVSAPGEGDDLELFFWDGSVRKHTRNSVDDVRPVLVDGKIAWQSGSSVLLDEGDRTLVLSQTAGFPEFDGEGVVFFGNLPESQRSGLVYYDGVSVRMLSDPSQSVSPLSRIAGQYVVWTDLQNDYSVHLYDGQSTIELAGPGMGGLADVDESGNVVWLRRYDDQGNDVMFYNGVETIQLTHDGLPKDSLSIDDGIAAWSTDGESTVSVSIFDGRQIRTPNFYSSSAPFVSDGRVAFLAIESATAQPQVHVTNAQTYHRVTVGENQTASEIDFGNNADQPILSGIVFEDRNANGVIDVGEPRGSGLEVSLHDGSDLLQEVVETDANGFYRFVVDPGASYRLIAEMPSDAVLTTSPTNFLSATAASGVNVENLNFGLFTQTRLSGFVFEDLDGDGVFDDDEVGLSKTDVTVQDQVLLGAIPRFSATVQTNSNGYYQVVVQPDDTYVITSETESGRYVTTPNRGVHTVAAPEGGSLLGNLDFGHAPIPIISGVLFEDINGNGIHESGEPLIAGQSVLLIDESGRVLETQSSGSDGRYQFSVGTNREYSITTSLPNDSVWTTLKSQSHTVTLADGQSRSDLDFGRFETISIGGVAFNDLNGNGTRNADEFELASWTVRLDLDRDGTFDRTTTTDARGIYQFSNVGPGRHAIEQLPMTGWSRTVPVAVEYVVDSMSGQDVNSLHFGNLRNIPSIAGQVFHDFNENGTRDGEEYGLDGWRIEVIDAATGALVATAESASTDLNGDGVIQDDELGYYGIEVPPGEYDVRTISQPGFQQTAPLDRTARTLANAVSDHAISDDGRFVVYAPSENLSSPSPSFKIHDLVTDTIDHVDLKDVPGFEGLSFFTDLTWSGNGNFIGFIAAKSNSNETSLFLFDRSTREFELINTNSSALTDTRAFDLSDDARYVVIVRSKDDTNAPFGHRRDIVLLDRTTGSLESVATESDFPDFELQLGRDLGHASINGDGSRVAFTSAIGQQADSGPSHGTNVFVFDRLQNSVTTVGPGRSSELKISADGRFLVYSSNPHADSTKHAISIHEIETGNEDLINIHEGELGVFGSDFSITSDGRYVGFRSSIEKFTTNSNSQFRVYRYDRVTGVLTTLNQNLDGELLPDSSGSQVAASNLDLSADGKSFVWAGDTSSIYVGTIDTQHRVNVVATEMQVVDFANLYVGSLFDEIDDVILNEDETLLLRFPGAWTDFPDRSVVFFGHLSGFGTSQIVDENFINQQDTGDEDEYILTNSLRWTVSLVDDAAGTLPITARLEHNGRVTERTITVTWNPVNDAPVLDTAIELMLPPTAPGSTDDGVLVKTMLESDSPAKPISDVDDDALQGIAVTGFETTAGTWQYSIDDGATWTTFPTSNLPVHVTLLAADDQTRIRLLSSADFTGTSDIFFRAWDQTSGSNGGSAAIVSAGDIGSATAFSSAISNAAITVIEPDTDGDGVADSIEDAAPNNGDGNKDGIQDRAQAYVSSLANAVDGTYVTVVAPTGTTLVAVSATANPTLESQLSGFQSPIGIINYEIHGVPIGGTIDVNLILHNQARLTHYYKYGPTPKNPQPHFYAFENESDHGIRRIKKGEVTLRFTDGLTGDDDLTANGVIVDPGVPVNQSHGAAQNPIEPTDVNNDDRVSALDALLVLNELGRIGQKDQFAFERDSDFFFDVNGDRSVSALDALLVINTIARRDSVIESAPTPPTSPEASPVDQWMADDMALSSSSGLGNPVGTGRRELEPVRELSTTLTANTDGEMSRKREYESAVDHWLGSSLF